MKRAATAAISVFVALTAFAQSPQFSTGFFPVFKYIDENYNTSYALYNRSTDSYVTSFEYDGMSPVYDGYAMAYLKDGAHYFIDMEGKRAYGGPWMTDATIFHDGLAWIADGKGNLTAVNTSFEPQFSVAAYEAYAFNDGFSVIRSKEGFGILDKKGNLLGGTYYSKILPFVSGGRAAVADKTGKWALFSVEQGKSPRQLSPFKYYWVGCYVEESGAREMIKSLSGKYIPAYDDESGNCVALDRNGKEKALGYDYVNYYDGLFRCSNEDEDESWFNTDLESVPVEEDYYEEYYEEDDEDFDPDSYKVLIPGTDLYIKWQDEETALVYEDGRIYSDYAERHFSDLLTGDYYNYNTREYLTAFSFPRYSTISMLTSGEGYFFYGSDPSDFYSSPLPMVTSDTEKSRFKGAGPAAQAETGSVLVDIYSGEIKSKKYSSMSFVHSGYAVVMNEDGTYSYVSDSGTPAFDGKSWKSATIFSYGRAFVCDFDGKIHCINTDGNDVYTLTGVDYVFSYNEGFAVMKTSQGGWGVLDSEGNIKFQSASYTDAMPFVEGYSFYVADSDGDWGSLNPSDGSQKMPFAFDGVGCQPTEGLSLLADNLGGEVIPVRVGEKYALAKSSDGKYVTKPEYDFLIRDGGLFQATRDGHTGWINEKGETIIDFNYGWAGYFGRHKYAPVSLFGDETSENVFYIDMYGHQVSPRKYFIGENASKGGYFSTAVNGAGNSTKWILYDINFKVIDEGYLAYTPVTYSDYIIATDDEGRQGIIDESGNIRVPFASNEFDTIQVPGRILPPYMYEWMTCYMREDIKSDIFENAFRYY